ncbi:hypothetical protein ABID24_003830 [Blautia caecimuris]|uniref:Uncharacterized protein n=1 Tax=Blautia caecimuris TaxID=1796615 RepID=A0ABV2M7V6_9FIRM
MELENKDILERSVSEKMCSSGSNGVGEICSPGTADTYRDLCVATKTNYVEILNFRHFFKHIVFTSEGDKIRNKEIKNYINVSVVVDIECGNTKN